MMTHHVSGRRLRPREPHFLDNLFGGGGGGGGGTKFYKWYKGFLQDQQAKQELDQKRVDEQRDTQAEVRRNEIADRQGYAGLVNVGDAVQRSDATLAADMSRLGADDPQRAAYDNALAAEAKKKEQATRIITGEQYEAEDAFRALEKRLGKVEFGNDYGKDLDKILADLDTNKGKYDFYETDLAARIKKKREEYDARWNAINTPQPVEPGG